MHIPPRFLHGVGHYLCHVGIIALDPKMVTSWLPDELELGPQDITTNGTHPVFLLFGKEKDVHLSWLPFLKLDYMEFAVVIPFTQWKSNTMKYKGPFIYTALLYLDDWLGIQAGRILYGFPKKRANFITNYDYFGIEDQEANQKIIDAKITKIETPVTNAEKKLIQKIIQQPSISRKEDGSYVGSGFYWNIDKAEIIKEQATVSIIDWWMPTLAKGQSTLELKDLNNLNQGGFFHIDTIWSLTLPMNPDLDWSCYNDIG